MNHHPFSACRSAATLLLQPGTIHASAAAATSKSRFTNNSSFLKDTLQPRPTTMTMQTLSCACGDLHPFSARVTDWLRTSPSAGLYVSALENGAHLQLPTQQTKGTVNAEHVCCSPLEVKLAHTQTNRCTTCKLFYTRRAAGSVWSCTHKKQRKKKKRVCASSSPCHSQTVFISPLISLGY